jgi:hypothetical protein
VTTRGAPNSYTLRRNAPDRVLQEKRRRCRLARHRPQPGHTSRNQRNTQYSESAGAPVPFCSGFSLMRASAVSRRLATDAAFCSAERTRTWAQRSRHSSSVCAQLRRTPPYVLLSEERIPALTVLSSLLCVISAVEPERPMPSQASRRGSRTSATTCPRTGLPSWPFPSAVLSSVSRDSWSEYVNQ